MCQMCQTAMIETTCQLVPVAVEVVADPDGLFGPGTGTGTGTGTAPDEAGNWAAVTLTADTEYLLTLTTPGEATIRVYDATGTLVHDSGSGATGAAFVAAADGNYYIQTIPDATAPVSVSEIVTPSVTVTISTGLTGGSAAPSAGVASITQMASYLTTGFWLETGQIPHAFNTSSSNVLTVNLNGLRPGDREMARDALDAWAMVANVTFREVSGSADITFDDTQSGAFASYTTLTNGDTVETRINIGTAFSDQNGAGVGSYTYQTYLHEIGHTLGLGHPGNYGTSGGTRYANDSWQISTMSYTSQDRNAQVNAERAVVVTPMMADITAVQMLYGTPGGSGATVGNTTYGVGATLDMYLDSFFAGQAGSLSRNAMTIYDQGGIDRIDFSTDTAAQTVNLNGGTYSSVYGLTGNLGIAQGTVIENYIAGSGADRITGNAVANQIEGRNGNDLLYGGGANDRLFGGIGNDSLYGGMANDFLDAGSANDTAWGGDGIDTLYGRDGNDVLHGEIGNDRLYGEAGLDRLFGGMGNDSLYGGMGNDTLDGGTQNDSAWGGDGIDTLYGRDGNDILRGDAGDDRIYGGNGIDTAYGGLGNDSLYGEAGNDRLFGDAGNDLLDGGIGFDTLLGGDGNDRLFGGDGNDSLNGGGGIDTLNGGRGNDVLTGSIGADVFVFTSGQDRVTDFLDNVDVLHLDDALWGGRRLSVTQVLDTYGQVVNGDVVLDFGNGNRITIENITRSGALTDDIVII